MCAQKTREKLAHSSQNKERMRRVSALWGGGGAVKAPLPPKAAAGPDRPAPPTDPPPADKSWLVDTKMIEDMAVMVPSSPEDVDDATKQLFLSRTFTAEEYRDWDFVMYNLGVALDIFPDTTTFVELKWVFVSQSIRTERA